MSKLISFSISFLMVLTLSACGGANLTEEGGETVDSGQNDPIVNDDSNNGNTTPEENDEQNDGQNPNNPDDSAADVRWQLIPERSHLNFVTTKKIHAVESHRFGELDGIIDEAGLALFQIDLASVDTGVELRDQRMRDLFFDVANYPLAEVSAEVDLEALEQLAIGQRDVSEYAVNLSLHGLTQTLNVELITQRLDQKNMLVQSQQPILIDALDFSFAEGLAELKQLAKLDSISTAVPVDLFLVFTFSEQE